MKLKKLIWVLFVISFIPIAVFQLIVVYKEVFSGNLNLKDIGVFLLMIELLLAGITAFYENGHFPIRYLLIFIISALVFYLALNKPTMEWYEVVMYTTCIILLTLAYMNVRVTNKKHSLSEI